jgi:predicted AlkP superfamily pyrophosphatase or phosphodiesterase
MNRFLFVLLIVLTASNKVYSQPVAEQPKLVVGIVVDQMRYDYIHRFWNKFSDKGFKRLVNQGFWCKDTRYNYVPTYTGPGHASIYTGTTPSRHGIVSNDWYEREINEMVYCTGDKTVKAIGCADSKAGRMSPKRMLAATIGDELKLVTHGQSKVFGIALKDRGAILPAGHAANAAFWFDSKCGNWISSSYYMNELPTWLQTHNGEQHPQKFIKSTWNTLFPIEQYTESLPDNNAYETPFKGKDSPTFPYDFAQLSNQNNGFDLLKFSPFGNTLTRLLAEALIKGENLGKSKFTDFLAISFSSPDYVGHRFGISSIEVEDIYIRLDLELAALFDFVDAYLGNKNVLYFLTADHAGVEVPSYQTSLKIPSGYLNFKPLKAKINGIAKQKWGLDSLVLDISSNQIYFDRKALAQKEIDLNQVQQMVLIEAYNYPGILSAFAANDLMRNSSYDGIGSMVKNGFMWKRSGDVALVPLPNWIEYETQTGTTHVSSYVYDTKVPMFFYGWKIRSGESTDTFFINDIAPTVANFLNLSTPNASDGKIIPLPLNK